MMKIKGISLFEQHVEKGVLGLAVVAMIGVAAWQFLGSSSTITMDGRQVAPGEVDDILVQRADALLRHLGEQAPMVTNPFPDEVPLLADSFVAELIAGVGVAAPLPPLAPTLAQSLIPVDLGAAVWFAEPRFVAPDIRPVVQQTDDAFTDEIVQAVSEVRTRDVSFLTPSATISPKELREALRATDPSANPPRSAIPSLWYNDRLFVLDLLCEREERLSDGAWGNRRLVAPLPGQASLREEIADAPDASDRNRMLERLSDAAFQRSILQPDFLPTRNSAFVPPSMADEVSGRDETVQRLMRDYERLRFATGRTRDRLGAIGGPLEDEEAGGAGRPPGRPGGGDRGRGGTPPGDGGVAPPGGAPGGSGLGGPAGPQGPGGGGASQPGGAADDEAQRRQRRALTQQLRREEARVAQIEAELRTVAPEVFEDRTAIDRAAFSLAEDAPIQVWAHDIDVTPGAVYRYRFVARMYNPFFARKRQLVAEQGQLAETIYIDSLVSGWTDAVEVDPPVSFFVSRATPGDGPLGLGSAQVEVFKLHEGRWRREVFTVAPGDRIGRPVTPPRGRDGEEAIDFTTEWFVVDIVDDPIAAPRDDRARGAVVVLQRIGGRERFVVRDPSTDQADRKRERLFRDLSVS